MVLLAGLFLAGCSTVSSKEPLGDPTSAEDAKKLEGVWLAADEPLWIRHIKDNELRLGSLSWNKDHSRFELAEAAVFVTKDDDRSYVNVKGLGANEEQDFCFARLAGIDDDSIVMFFPRTDAFAEAVENGTLPGTVTRAQTTAVRLSATAAQLGEFVDPEKTSVQFDVDAAIPLRRVQRVEKE